MKDPLEIKLPKDHEIKPIKLVEGLVGVTLGIGLLIPALNLLKNGGKNG